MQKSQNFIKIREACSSWECANSECTRKKITDVVQKGVIEPLGLGVGLDNIRINATLLSVGNIRERSLCSTSGDPISYKWYLESCRIPSEIYDVPRMIKKENVSNNDCVASTSYPVTGIYVFLCIYFELF